MLSMLETYSLSYKGKTGNDKNYELKFKVAKGVQVVYKTVGNINQIHLSSVQEVVDPNEKKKNYKVTGPLDIQFFMHPAAGAGKDGGESTSGNPDLEITVRP